MVSRTAVGAIAGAVVGGGFYLNLGLLIRYCNAPLRITSCGEVLPMLIPAMFAFWMLVAGVLIALGFRVRREARGWRATGIGSGLWVAVIVPLSYSGLLGKHGWPQFVEVVAVLVPCLAFATAALCTGRRRSVAA